MSESEPGFRLFGRTPLYVQILIALVLAVITGLLLDAGNYAPTHTDFINNVGQQT